MVTGTLLWSCLQIQCLENSLPVLFWPVYSKRVILTELVVYTVGFALSPHQQKECRDDDTTVESGFCR